MLRTRLLTATAAVALFAAPAAFAQDASTGGMTPMPQDPAATTPAPQPVPAPVPEATTPAPAAEATTDSTVTADATTPAAGNTVVDVLKAHGQFNTLVTALEAAQLTETLATQGAVSIFAPTDAAFAALPEAERTRLMDPANVNELRQLLLYHVVVADVNSSQIQGAAGGVQTAAETNVQLDGTGSQIKVDNATVVQADIDASNGAIFAIDQVLNPANSQAAMGDDEAAPAATEEAPAADAAPATETPADDAAMSDDAALAASEVPAEATTTPPLPAEPGTTAPSGEPAATTTTTASPPVPNPTDGQVDGEGTEEEPTPEA